MALRRKRRGLLARLGRAVLAEGARLCRDFPEIRPGHALLADRTGRTSERRAARSCSLILTANPSPPRMLRARDRRGPVVILPGTRGVAPGSDEMPNTARRDSARRIGESLKETRAGREVSRFRARRRDEIKNFQRRPPRAPTAANTHSVDVRYYNPALTSALSVTIPNSSLLTSSRTTGRNETFTCGGSGAIARSASAAAVFFVVIRHVREHSSFIARRVHAVRRTPRVAGDRRRAPGGERPDVHGNGGE